MKKDSKPRSGQIKKHLMKCFVVLMKQMKWDKIKVSRLCEEAGIARGTFYLHFHSIYELLDELERELLEDLCRHYSCVEYKIKESWPPEMFDEKFDCNPPALLKEWFEFCRENKAAMAVLLDRKRGDAYFVKKLKQIINKGVNEMMDEDGMPDDRLRSQFLTVFTEIHFLAAYTWLAEDDREVLQAEEVVHLLNTMRIGANYLSNRQRMEKERRERMG